MSLELRRTRAVRGPRLKSTGDFPPIRSARGGARRPRGEVSETPRDAETLRNRRQLNAPKARLGPQRQKRTPERSTETSDLRSVSRCHEMQSAECHEMQSAECHEMQSAECHEMQSAEPPIAEQSRGSGFVGQSKIFRACRFLRAASPCATMMWASRGSW